VVTELTEPPDDVPLDVPVEVSLDVPVEVPLDVAGVDATVVAEDEEVADEAFLASAGSCPDTSTIAISSQAATNNATDPATIRRRMLRARAARAFLSASPRARAAAALVSLMSCTSVLVGLIHGSKRREEASGPLVSAA
jgi:hypothetical protein